MRCYPGAAIAALRPDAIGTRGAIPISMQQLVLTAKRLAAAEFERRYLVCVMERAGGSVSEGARLSGLDHTNFRRLLQRHGLRYTELTMKTNKTTKKSAAREIARTRTSPAQLDREIAEALARNVDGLPMVRVRMDRPQVDSGQPQDQTPLRVRRADDVRRITQDPVGTFPARPEDTMQSNDPEGDLDAMLELAVFFQDDYSKKLPVIAVFRRWRSGHLSTEAFLKRLSEDNLADVLLRYEPVPPMLGLALLNEHRRDNRQTETSEESWAETSEGSWATDPVDKLYSVRDLDLTPLRRLSRRTRYRLVSSGDLPALTINGRHYVSKAAVIELLRRQERREQLSAHRATSS